MLQQSSNSLSSNNPYLQMLSMPGSFPRRQTNATVEVEEVLETQEAQQQLSYIDQWPDDGGLPSELINQQWHHHQYPSELTQAPNDLFLPPELQTILKWSLERPPAIEGLDRSASVSTRSLHSARCEQESDTPETLPHQISLPQLQPPNDSRSRTPSVHSGRSQSPGSKPARQVRKSLLTAPNVLFQSLKNKIEDAHEKKAAKLAKDQAPVECTSCFDEFPANSADVYALPCRHSYCRPCLATLISTAAQSEATFPPKCCLTPIPLQTIVKALATAIERNAYKDKAAEYALPSDKRWYCPNPTTCGRWIPPKKLRSFTWNGERWFSCPHCETRVCGLCRGIAHEKNGVHGECPQDFGLRQTLEISEAEGWQRCYKCHTMVELTNGCRHITCRCGAQFCYVCNARWKTCACTESDKDAKLARVRSERARRDDDRTREELEVAHAILAIEEMERQDEEERQAEEARHVELLARLERERIAEEEQRAREAEEMERLRKVAIKDSCLMNLEELRTVLKTVAQYQQHALVSRHDAERKNLQMSLDQATKQQTEEAERMMSRVNTNVEKRQQAMSIRHAHELAELSLQHEQDSDEFFLELQVHLRGRPNRKEREARMQADFDAKQHQDTKELENKHKTQREALMQNADMERQGVELYTKTLTSETSGILTQTESLSVIVSCERKWFEVVTERRAAMLEKHGQISLDQLNSGADEVTSALTERIAATVLPLPEPVLSDWLDHTADHAQTNNSDRDSFKESVDGEQSCSVPPLTLKKYPTPFPPLREPTATHFARLPPPIPMAHFRVHNTPSIRRRPLSSTSMNNNTTGSGSTPPPPMISISTLHRHISQRQAQIDLQAARLKELLAKVSQDLGESEFELEVPAGQGGLDMSRFAAELDGSYSAGNGMDTGAAMSMDGRVSVELV